LVETRPCRQEEEKNRKFLLNKTYCGATKGSRNDVKKEFPLCVQRDLTCSKSEAMTERKRERAD